MTGDGSAAVYVSARGRARGVATWRLRRLERAFRRAATSSGARLDRPAVAVWVACRAELRARGRRVPDAERRPARWSPWPR